MYFVWFSLLTYYFQAFVNLNCTLCPHRYIILVHKLTGLSFSVVIWHSVLRAHAHAQTYLPQTHNLCASVCMYKCVYLGTSADVL